MKRLKKCPFCGGDVACNKVWTRGGYYASISCMECNAQSKTLFRPASMNEDHADYLAGYDNSTFDDLAAAWNTRTPLTESAD